MPVLTIGSYDIFLFHDGIYTAPITDITHARGEEARADAIARWGRDSFSVDVNCFGLRGPDGLTLVDAGAGERWGPNYGHASSAIAEAGFSPSDVKTVLLTHAHGDHAFGLLDGDACRYPDAIVRVPRRDLEWYGEPGNEVLTPEGLRGGFKIIGLLRRAYAERLVSVEAGPVMRGVEAIALPGHTPGHTGYLVEDQGAGLLLWGDVIHLGQLQFSDPRIGSAYDLDPGAALESRKAALNSAASSGWYVGGGHVTGLRRIERVEGGFGYVEDHDA